jgi:hypothetical protein
MTNQPQIILHGDNSSSNFLPTPFDPILPNEWECPNSTMLEYLRRCENILNGTHTLSSQWVRILMKHLKQNSLMLLQVEQLDDTSPWELVKGKLVEHFAPILTPREQYFQISPYTNAGDFLLHARLRINQLDSDDLKVIALSHLYSPKQWELIKSKTNFMKVSYSELTALIHSLENDLNKLSLPTTTQTSNNSNQTSKCTLHPNSSHSNANCFVQHPEKRPPSRNSPKLRLNNLSSSDSTERMSVVNLNLRNGISITAGLDTGAETNFMTKETMENLNLTPNYIEKVSIVKGNGNSEICSSRIQDLEVSHGNCSTNLSFHVIEELPYGLEAVLAKSAIRKLELGPLLLEEEPDLNYVIKTPVTPYMPFSSLSETLALNEKIAPNSCYLFAKHFVSIDTPNLKEPLNVNQQSAIPFVHYPEVSAIISRWLKEGRIVETSFNGWCLPLITAPKANGKIRLCLNPKRLNKFIENNSLCVIPKIPELIRKTATKKFFFKLDLLESFLQLPLKANDAVKTTFFWENHYYHFVGAPFGLKHLTFEMQHALEKILHPVIDNVSVYVDDIIGFSEDEKGLENLLIQTISLLNENNLKLNIGKCLFKAKSLKGLGFHLDGSGYNIDPTNIEKCLSFPLPKTIHQLQSFLGMCNFARNHVFRYAELVAPLDSLRNKSRLYDTDWTSERVKAFYDLKKGLVESIKLSHPITNEPFILQTDASKVSISAVLLQERHNGRVIIDMRSRKLSPREQNHSAHKRELNAIIFGLKQFKNFIYGTHFTLECDNQALLALEHSIPLTAFEMGWIEDILTYDFSMRHIPGSQNILADSLTRIPIENEIIDSKNLEKIHFNYISSPFLSDSEKKNLLENTHSLAHCGGHQLNDQLQRKGFNWPNMLQDCLDFTKNCIHCQHFNPGKKGFHPLTSISASNPMDHIAIDLAGPFTTSSRGNSYILVIFDYHTKFRFLFPLPNREAISVAKPLLNLFFTFGFPKIMQSDNGSEFVNQIMKHVVDFGGIDKRVISAYYPRANGGVENSIKLVKRILGILVDGREEDWENFIGVTQYHLNQSIHSSHGCTPFFAMFARAPNDFSDYRNLSLLTTTNPRTIRNRLQEIQDSLRPLINKFNSDYQEKVKKKHDSQSSVTSEILQPGQTVYVEITPDQRTSLSPIYDGPFQIVRRTRSGNYILCTERGRKLRKHYPLSKLKTTNIINHLPQENQHIQQMQKIISHEENPQGMKYLIRWKGLNSDHDSWLERRDIVDYRLLANYWKKVRRHTSPTHANSDVREENGASAPIT